jgi:hypothetical protein
MSEDSSRDKATVILTRVGDALTLKTTAESVTLTAEEAEELARQILEAAARAHGQDPDESDSVRIPMQYIRVAAERLDDAIVQTESGEPANNEAPDTGDAKNAEVHCWIKGQTQQNAMHVASGWVNEHGWIITEVIEQEAVTSDDFEGTEYLQYYEQALTESEVFLYEIDDTQADQDETEGSADAP